MHVKGRDGNHYYQLMNKDIPVLSFGVGRNEYGQPVFREDVRYGAPLPIGFLDIGSWLVGRRAPVHRVYIEKVLAEYGCTDLEDYALATRAVSLNDTFWVKEVGVSEKWEDVSPYRNNLDVVIANLAFGDNEPGRALSSISPEFGTDGSYAKCWVRDNKGTWLLKRGFAGRYEDGLEPYSEQYASEIADALCGHSVPYWVTEHHGKTVSKCPLFTDESVGYAPFYRCADDTRDVSVIMDFMYRHGAEDDFRRMVVLDALICNTDRHSGNYGMLFDTDTLEITGMAPVFDHNLSLFPNTETELLEQYPEQCVSICRPKIGEDFVRMAKLMLTDDIRADLKNLRGFKFRRGGEYALPERRLMALERIVNMQINAVLEV